jgi:hypothetical protein
VSAAAGTRSGLILSRSDLDFHAGGARMWLEERTGKRINEERIDEALALDPDTVSTACPYCMVMLGDAVSTPRRQPARPRKPSKS